jgi:hypothetical protein
MEELPLTAIALSRLHDAELYRISMDRGESTLELKFRGTHGSIYQLIFGEIVTYRINNIQYQNVVSTIFYSISVVDEARPEIEKLTRWTCSGASDVLLIPEIKVEEIIERILEKKIKLLYIDPSWGAEIGVIAASITLL